MKESPLRDLSRKLREVARQHVAYSQVAEFMKHVDEHLSALAYCEESNQSELARQKSEGLELSD